ncbi:MAG TPA: S-layer homology domain-containing protein [Bacillota bacterium]|nr:S-layer homology domain-containing protein [Bacillota bacterium]
MMISTKSRIASAISIALVFLLCFGAVAAPQVKDVPKDHWAYEAVMKLVDKGYLGVYDDGTFKGDEGVNRYLLAFVVAKMLTDLEKGTIAATGEDMGILREVANELRGEIVPLMSAIDLRVKALEGQSVDANKALVGERQERKAEAAEILADLDGQAVRMKAIDDAIAGTKQGIASLEKSLADEKAAKDKLIMALMAEAEGDKAETEKAIERLEEARKRSEAGLGTLSADVTALKAALGADIDKAVSDLSAYLEKESGSRKALEEKIAALEGKTGKDLEAAVSSMKEWAAAEHSAAAAKCLKDLRELEGRQGKALDDSAAELKARMLAELAVMGARLDDAVESLGSYVGEEERLRTAADAALSAKLADLDRMLGADIEKSAAGLLAGIEKETEDRKAEDAALKSALEAGRQEAVKALADEKALREQADRKLEDRVAALLKSLDETNFNTTALILKVASEQAAQNDGYDASIASLRKAMDTANLNISSVKSDLAAVTGRVGALETSLSVVKANLETAISQLVSVKNDLATLTLKHNALDAKVAALQTDVDAKMKKAAQDANDLMTAQSWEAQERENALKQQIKDLEMKLSEQDQTMGAQMKKLQGFGIVGIVLGAIGAIVGIIALFLPSAP